MHTIPENNLRLLFSDTYIIDKFIRTYRSSIRLHCKADIRNPLYNVTGCWTGKYV